MMSDTTLGGTELKRKKKHGEDTRNHKERSGAHRDHNDPNLTKVLFLRRVVFAKSALKFWDLPILDFKKGCNNYCLTRKG